MSDLIQRLRRADDPADDAFIPGVGHMFGEAADEIERRDAYDEVLFRVVDRFIDGSATHREVVEAAEDWRHADRNPQPADDGGAS